ncbi:hypothetical protein BKI52_45085 [marine bacterium AO1-C]|nr:hypothetical protein BKI52_45085 [marine bacterium AO1-C]
MQTKLERQANQLWEGFEEGSTKFWKKYEQLIQASRDAVKEAPVVLQSQPGGILDTFTAYAQLPEAHYPELFKKTPFFDSDSMPLSFVVSVVLGNWVFSGIMPGPAGVILGPAVLFAGFLGLRFWQRENIFEAKNMLSLDIQPDYLQFGPKDKQKKVPFKYITGFSMTKKAIKLSAEFPHKGNDVLEKTYTIPLRKGKRKRFSTIELNALKQLLDAIMYENEVLKKYKSDAN